MNGGISRCPQQPRQTTFLTAKDALIFPVLGAIVPGVFDFSKEKDRRRPMAWTRPTLREICLGMEINGYFTARI
jgi:coenzyme PQQ precursor peptide PqqA